jgi:hypothetical protein
MLDNLLNIGSLRTAVTLDDLKRNFLAFVERPVAVLTNGRKVHKYIVSAFPFDESIAFLRAKPLDRSLKHAHLLNKTTNQQLNTSIPPYSHQGNTKAASIAKYITLERLIDQE